MAPRANWKGFLRLSLVTCPVALYPATSESEKVSFNQLNKQTGHRIKYVKMDADTGEEVSNEDIVKGYKVDTDIYIEVTKEELENVAWASRSSVKNGPRAIMSLTSWKLCGGASEAVPSRNPRRTQPRKLERPRAARRNC